MNFSSKLKASPSLTTTTEDEKGEEGKRKRKKMKGNYTILPGNPGQNGMGQFTFLLSFLCGTCK